MASWSDLVAFIQRHEGGLSDAPASVDPAAKYPSPVVNPKTGRRYHTNKGVTWTTFVSSAPTLGYVASADNFMKMPEEIWLSLLKKGYYSPITKDKIKSRPVAFLLAETAWGMGVGGAAYVARKTLHNHFGSPIQAGTTAQGMKDDAIDAINRANPEAFFKFFQEERMNYLRSLSNFKSNPGWVTRVNEFSDQFGPSSKWWGLAIVSGIFLVFGSLYFVLR